MNSLDNNILDLLNYKVGGGFTIFELLSDIYSSDSKKKSQASSMLYQLNVESDELKFP